MLTLNDILGGGLGPSLLDGPASASMVAFAFENFVTQNLDLTLTVSGMEIVPARPGHIALLARGAWIINTKTGTQTVPAQIQAGSDAAHTNFFPSSADPSNANVNGVAGVPSFFASGLGTGTSTARRIVNAPVFMDITAGATGTGGFTLVGRLQISVIWAAVGS